MFETPIIKNIDYEKVYEPAEDSYLLLDCFESQKPFLDTHLFSSKTPLIVEIGTGSGIVTTFIHKNIISSGLFLTTDINPHGCRGSLITSANNGGTSYIDTCQTNLTTCVRNGLIDVLVFNPPYVPAEEVPAVPEREDDDAWLDLALLGGDDGMVVTNVLLDDLDHILAQGGLAYILFCARNKPDEVISRMEEKGWRCDVVINRKAGWEVLSVVRFMRGVVDV